MIQFFRNALDGAPKIVRLIAYISLGFFVFLGFGTSFQLLLISPVRFFFMLLYFIGLGLLLFIGTLHIWKFLQKSAKKKILRQMETVYQSTGFSMELAQCAQVATAIPTNADLLLHAFLLTMAEDYREAENALRNIPVASLSHREEAMLYTIRMQICSMTNKDEKLQKLFEAHHESLDGAYAIQANFLGGDYVPYADDALVYYILAAALSAHNGKPEAQRAYESRANFQITNRSGAEIECIPEIIRLNALYATNQLEEAHNMEVELQGKIINLPMSNSAKDYLSRLLGQARIYGTYQKFIDNRMMERVTPVGYADAPPAALPDGLSEF